MLLKDRVVLITGGSRGIGRAVAIGMAREGAKVVVTGREAGPCEEVAGVIENEGLGTALAMAADVSKRQDVHRVVDAIVGQFGRIDVLLACAGVIAPSRFLDLTEEQWNRTIGINLNGTFFSMQAVLPHMLKQGRGKVITVTGPAALRASPNGVSDYAASKGAIIALTKNVAMEMRATGASISINCVSPVANTRMTEAMAQFRGLSMDQFRAQRPGGGAPTVEDVVPTFVFLASDGADHMTGQVIAVDDGSTV